MLVQLPQKRYTRRLRRAVPAHYFLRNVAYRAIQRLWWVILGWSSGYWCGTAADGDYFGVPSVTKAQSREALSNFVALHSLIYFVLYGKTVASKRSKHAIVCV